MESNGRNAINLGGGRKAVDDGEIDIDAILENMEKKIASLKSNQSEHCMRESGTSETDSQEDVIDQTCEEHSPLKWVFTSNLNATKGCPLDRSHVIRNKERKDTCPLNPASGKCKGTVTNLNATKGCPLDRSHVIRNKERKDTCPLNPASGKCKGHMDTAEVLQSTDAGTMNETCRRSLIEVKEMSHDAADRPLDLSLLTGTCSSNNKTEETKDTEVAVEKKEEQHKITDDPLNRENDSHVLSSDNSMTVGSDGLTMSDAWLHNCTTRDVNENGSGDHGNNTSTVNSNGTISIPYENDQQFQSDLNNILDNIVQNTVQDEVQGNAELPTQSDPEQKSPVHNDIKESHSIPLQTVTSSELSLPSCERREMNGDVTPTDEYCDEDLQTRLLRLRSPTVHPPIYTQCPSEGDSDFLQDLDTPPSAKKLKVDIIPAVSTKQHTETDTKPDLFRHCEGNKRQPPEHLKYKYWADFQNYVKALKRKVGVLDNTTGFGLIESVQQCLAMDYDILLSKREIFNRVAQELVDNPEYTRYMNTDLPLEEEVQANLVSTLNNKEAGKIIYDMYLQPIAAALDLNIVIYEEVNNFISMRSAVPTDRISEKAKKVHLCWLDGAYKPLINLNENCREPSPVTFDNKEDELSKDIIAFPNPTAEIEDLQNQDKDTFLQATPTERHPHMTDVRVVRDSIETPPRKLTPQDNRDYTVEEIKAMFARSPGPIVPRSLTPSSTLSTPDWGIGIHHFQPEEQVEAESTPPIPTKSSNLLGKKGSTLHGGSDSSQDNLSVPAKTFQPIGKAKRQLTWTSPSREEPSEVTGQNENLSKSPNSTHNEETGADEVPKQMSSTPVATSSGDEANADHDIYLEAVYNELPSPQLPSDSSDLDTTQGKINSSKKLVNTNTLKQNSTEHLQAIHLETASDNSSFQKPPMDNWSGRNKQDEIQGTEQQVDDMSLVPAKSMANISLSNKLGRGYTLNMDSLLTLTAEVVQELPYDIDGNKHYKIKIDEDEGDAWTKKYKDGRHFTFTTTTRKGFQGKRRLGKCQGNYICENDNCDIYQSTHRRNYQQFKTVGGKKYCISCDCLSFRKACPALKVVEYNITARLMSVFHTGSHCCVPKKNTKEEDAFIENAVKKYNGSLGCRELARELMTEEMRKQEEDGTADMDKIVRIAANLTDSKKIENIKRKIQTELRTERHSMSSVAKLKGMTDTKDNFYIRSMMDGTWNNSLSYIFKSSRYMLQILLQMDVKSTRNPLQEEVIYFDGMHQRCPGWKTLTAWMLHVPSRRLMRLATMEVKGETRESVKKFWELIRDSLREIKGDSNYNFEPKGWLTDEAQACKNGIIDVFGDQVKGRIYSCIFHFKKGLQRLIGRIPAECQETREEVETLGNQLVKVKSMVEYNGVVHRLNELAGLFHTIGTWTQWWTARRYNLFPYFRGFTIASMNLAEVGHSTLKRNKKLFLVDAAWEDVCTMIIQEEENKKFMEGWGNTYGRAKTLAHRALLDKKEQDRRADEYCRMFKAGVFDEDTGEDTFMYGKTASHREPELLPDGDVQGDFFSEDQYKPPSRSTKLVKKNVKRVNNKTTSATNSAPSKRVKIVQLKRNEDGTTSHIILQPTSVTQASVNGNSQSSNMKHIYATSGQIFRIPPPPVSGTSQPLSTQTAVVPAKSVQYITSILPQQAGISSTSNSGITKVYLAPTNTRHTMAYQAPISSSTVVNRRPLVVIPPSTQLQSAASTAVTCSTTTGFPAAQVSNTTNQQVSTSTCSINSPPLLRSEDEHGRIFSSIGIVEPGQKPLLHILKDKKIQVCKGCRGDYKSVRSSPKNIICKLYMRQKKYIHKKWVMDNYQTPGYFHLNIDCLRRLKCNWEYSDIYMPNEVKDQLTPAHMNYLRERDLLKYFQHRL